MAHIERERPGASPRIAILGVLVGFTHFAISSVLLLAMALSAMDLGPAEGKPTPPLFYVLAILQMPFGLLAWLILSTLHDLPRALLAAMLVANASTWGLGAAAWIRGRMVRRVPN